MNLHDYLSVSRGRAKQLSVSLGVSPVMVSQWAGGKKRVTEFRAIQIERLTNRQVTCEELRPDVDWAFLRNTTPVIPSASNQENI